MTRRRPASEDVATDRGSGLIEILVSITLLGLSGVGTLTAISAAIRGSADHEKLSGARRWIVSAADQLVSSDVIRVACTSGEAGVRAAYQTAAQNVTNGRPAGWAAGQLTVVAPVLFWDGSTFGSTCYEGNGLKLQQVTLQTTDASGEIDEILTVVKADG